jgi:hypothetical protein
VPAEDAAEQILAANIGVTLSLITMPQPDFGLSTRVRESALAGVLQVDDQATGLSRASAALTLRALVDEDPSGLTAGERALLGELLDRLSS